MSVPARARFFRRIVAAVIGLVVMAGLGVGAIGWLLAERAGLGGATGVALGALALLAGTFVLAAGFVTVRGGAGPLRAVMDAADRVADGDYTVHVHEHGPPPVRALAHAFNAMTQRLAHADRQRRDLMADVAHELRTPLSVLQGRLEGLLDGVYPRDDAQLASLLEETQVLSRLIEDLRTLALDDAGALRLEREPADLVGLVRDTVRGFEPEAARRRVTLAVSTDLGVAELDLDPVRIRQVLSNLLSNALRHTPTGSGVRISVAAIAAGFAVSVADAGDGIAPEDVARIFDRFYKGEASGGSGLGLTIARRLVEAHGGEIHAESRLGQGTTVFFTLPAGARLRGD
jgi:two-component system OmpR family sensor kinase/two-component system sensor histidine kinase BaeS